MIAARDDARTLGALPVPTHLRNAPTALMRKLGYGEDYLYPHNFAGAITDQSYMPAELDDRTYYAPTDRGYEARIRDYLDRVRKARTSARIAGAKKDREG
jgi:putative ATPase